ncbi:FAD:protein FMN transferase [Leminorella grimontii]|uniref:FAD:protein FMN transferase n=1 Tax=Leminorella grimontii TaxID=82981 RepID=A0AAV5N4K5_9GAMM|nr:FAD:protein FMN transferase [Leminorella grimontii]KFC97113.1 ApbE family thiamine biosynthesis lipoprotein [Leminorella grimontii ATCC 33999 = DSM 5078]GKX57043.1 FAD:protein FMN transferase [Leminorella grimontii]VFS57241.1 Thiamine biosynthesis lipoprotein ApbE precursor [Leminorella grimontii]
MNWFSRRLAPFAVAVSLLFIFGCQPERVSLDGKTMGTYYSIKYLPAPSAPGAEPLKQKIDALLEEVNDQMSTYRPASELSRFNQSRVVNQPFPVSAATVRVVNEAFRISRLSQGALDVTVGPLVNLWGFGPEARPDAPPDEAEIAQRRAWVGMDKLEVQGQSLIKRVPELYLDLSAIAKGYGVDAVAEYLESLGIQNYMVDIGGEVRTRGLNERKKLWRIAVEKPVTGVEQQVQRVVEPGNMSMATSGSYRNFFDADGIRYSHTLDPRSGRPIMSDVVSVTVISPSCMTADGWATALTVLGVKEGMALAESLGLPVMMISSTPEGFTEHFSSAFKPFLVAP